MFSNEKTEMMNKYGRKKREKYQGIELLKQNEIGNSSNTSNSQINPSKEYSNKLLKTYVSQSEFVRICSIFKYLVRDRLNLF